MIRLKLLSLASLICVVLAPVGALADDFAPPPWDRSSPFAITAEWEFFTPANPTPPDGPLTNVGAKGSGSVATSALITGTGGLGWGGGSGGNWFFPAGGDIRFTVDNVIDFMPDKHIRLQVTHSAGVGVFIDPLIGFNLGATGSTATVPVIITGTDPFHSLFVWDMHPNPPWESFLLHVTTPGEIRQVVVDTISTGVPEASTAVCYALGLLSVGIAFRICPRLWKQSLS